MDNSELFGVLSELAVNSSPALEYRLYYDESGGVVAYTTEQLPGTYIVVTQHQFAEARPDVRVVEGQLLYTHKPKHVTKLVQSLDGTGQATTYWDVNILSVSTDSDCRYWKQAVIEII